MRGTLKNIVIAALSTVLLFAGSGTPLAASAKESPAFLYIPGIQGNVDDPAHRSWIEVLSCDWGKVPPARGSMISSTGKGPAGKLCFGDFSFLKHVDESSKALATYCSRGIQFSHIRVELPSSEAGKFKYLILRKVKVLSVRPGRVTEDGSETELVTVSFRQVEYQ